VAFVFYYSAPPRSPPSFPTRRSPVLFDLGASYEISPHAVLRVAINTLRALNYPAQRELPRPGQLRAGEHTDLGMMTILKNEAADGGLEVRDLDGKWHEAPPVEDGFIVNIGDLAGRQVRQSRPAFK